MGQIDTKHSNSGPPSNKPIKKFNMPDNKTKCVSLFRFKSQLGQWGSVPFTFVHSLHTIHAQSCDFWFYYHRPTTEFFHTTARYNRLSY